MRAGKLRHQIVIEQSTEARNSVGEVTASWATFATVRASVEPMQGRESFVASQDLAERTVRFRIRYLAGITPKMRVSYDSRTFDIQSVVNREERNRETHILCREVI